MKRHFDDDWGHSHRQIHTTTMVELANVSRSRLQYWRICGEDWRLHKHVEDGMLMTVKSKEILITASNLSDEKYHHPRNPSYFPQQLVTTFTKNLKLFSGEFESLQTLLSAPEHKTWSLWSTLLPLESEYSLPFIGLPKTIKMVRNDQWRLYGLNWFGITERRSRCLSFRMRLQLAKSLRLSYKGWPLGKI